MDLSERNGGPMTVGDYSAVLIARVINVGTSGGTSIFLAATLGVGGFGGYSYALAVYMIASTFAQLGLQQAHVRLSRDGVSASILFTSMFLPVSIVGVFSGVLALFFLLRVTQEPGYEVHVLLLASVLTPVMALSALSANLLLLTGQRRRYLAATIISSSGYGATLLGLSLIDLLNVKSALVAYFVTPLSFLIASTFSFQLSETSRAISNSVLHTRLSLGFAPSVIMLYVRQRVDIIILGLFTDPQTLGVYALAIQAAQTMFTLSDAVNSTHLRELVSQHRPRILALRVAFRAFAMTVMVGILVSTGFWVLLQVTLKSSYQGAVPLLLWLMPGMLFSATSQPFAVLLVAANRQRFIALATLLSLLIFIALLVFAIPLLGATGAAVGKSLVLSVYSISLWMGFEHFQRRPG